eukprot:4780453-Prymnesium_polylepis.1
MIPADFGTVCRYLEFRWRGVTIFTVKTVLSVMDLWSQPGWRRKAYALVGLFGRRDEHDWLESLPDDMLRFTTVEGHGPRAHR